MEPTNLFDNRYNLIEKLGEGSYGTVYSATDTHVNRTFVLKISRYSLAREAQVYELLNRHPIPIGIPRMARYSKNVAEYIVMERLGTSVRHYWIHCWKHFSMKSVVMIGIQMISRLESVHSRGIVHGDIKEDNFVFDQQCQTLYIIDFGVSRSFLDPSTGAHIAEQRDEHILGTLYFASINTHNKILLSRRDDLEATAYVLVRLFKGALPWERNALQGGSFAEHFDQIGEIKKKTTLDALCEGLPEQFKHFIAYVRRLGFEEIPNYAYLQGLLRSVLVEQNIKDDGVYDWMMLF